MKERQVSNRRKHSSGASGSGSCVRGRRAKPRVTDLLVCLGLVAVTWAVFGQTLTHDFVNFDDHVYVYENPLVIRGLSTEGIIGAFTHTHARNWHPLTTLSHMLDCQLYGLNAGGHHLTNVILHTISVLLLFLVLKQMTGALWQSAFVAALFAIHPLHVESVAWIAERKDVLSAVFFMLTLAAYARYARAPSAPRYLLVALLFAFGLMSKPMLVTLPFVLLLLDYWPLGRIGGQKSEVGSRLRRLITEKIPLFALSALSCVATLLTQRQGPSAIDQLPFLWRLNNTFVSYVTYIWQMLWPVRLAVFYPHPNDRLPACGGYSGHRIPCWCQPASNLSATDKALPCYRLVLVSGNARSSDWPCSGRRASACRSLYVPATDRPLHHDSVGGWRSALRITVACSSSTSRRCCRNSNRVPGRARFCPNLLLEKQ